ncbi:MAG: hypothetical protein ACRD2E_08920 [Terriglobales bacterium]
MPEATHSINFQSTLAAEKSRDLAASMSKDMLPVMFVDFSVDPNIDRKPDYHIYLYNIADRRHEIRKPPLAPLIQIPACPPGTPFVCFATLPNIVNQKYVEAFTGQTLNTGYHGEALANDIVNPSNRLGTQWADTHDEFSIDTDLTVRGCFWSTENPPSNADLAKTRQRLETRYRGLIEQANRLLSQGKQHEISEEQHEAANYFRIEAPWHRVYSAPAACPICGEDVKPGVAFHVNSAGGTCILDWKRAVDGGIRTMADVPVEQRWPGPKW